MTILRGQQRPFHERFRVNYCFRCETDTQQAWLYSSNGSTPEITHWSCTRCAAEFYAMGNPRAGGVPDGEGLCKFVVNELIRTRKRRSDQDDDAALDPTRRAKLDYDDLLGHLREELLEAWVKFNPELAPSFTAYATTILRNRRTDWLRKQLGRDEPCPCEGDNADCDTCGGTGRFRPAPNMLAIAESIDAYERDDSIDTDGDHDAGVSPVGEAFRCLAEDGRDDSLAPLEWALLQRDRA